jgi:DNA-binding transcriptional regulator GbsR (MarR family)
MAKTTDFIEKFCVVAEQDGFPRIAGRMMGFLLLNEGPFTLDELADELQISKTSASTNARLLEQYGIIEHTTRPGDRRDFYRLAADPWEPMFAMAKQRMQRFNDVLNETIAALPAKEKYGRKRLQEARQFHASILEDFDRWIQQWRRVRAHAEE